LGTKGRLGGTWVGLEPKQLGLRRERNRSRVSRKPKGRKPSRDGQLHSPLQGKNKKQVKEAEREEESPGRVRTKGTWGCGKNLKGLKGP